MEQRKLGWTGFTVSVLGLGTVELGMAYGIRAEAPPPRAEAIALLQYAADQGITYFDTARSYGVAEELIGESGIGSRESVVIGTKCGAFYEDGEDPRGDDLRRRMTHEVNESLRALRRDRLDLLHIHGAPAVVYARGELAGILQDVKKEGKVRAFGAATRGEEAPIAAIRTGTFQTIQLAVSILDQRMRDRVLPEAFAAGAGVVARSAYLKGVLTPHREFLPKPLDPLRFRADAVEDYVTRAGLGLTEAAFRFALSVPEVSTVLIGTTKKEHIDQAVQFAKAGVLPAPVMAELSSFRLDDEQLVDPKHWSV